MDPQSAAEVQPASQVSHELQGNQQNSPTTEAPGVDSGSPSIASSDNRKVSREDIELVQNLIERCLQLYMNRGEVVRTLSNRARIEPGFTTLVNNVPMGYPVLQQQPMPTTGRPHVDPIGCGLSSCHVVNGIPAPGSFHPIHMNSGNDGAPEAAPAAAPCSAMLSVSETAVVPASVASSDHFPFTPTDLSGMSMDTSTLDANFTSDVANAGVLQLGPDGEIGSSRDSLRTGGQLWSFNLTDLTADFTNLGDLGALGSYTGSPFLPSDSDILLDSPEQEDIVEEYFADAIAGPCSRSDEENNTEPN